MHLKTKTGLALGGGAAKGAAHIGVLRALQEKDIQIDMIAGTSVGAAIAAFYAFGKSLDDIYTIARDMSASKISGFTFRKKGFIPTRRLESLIIELMGDVNIEDADIPLAIVATDIESGEKTVFRKGSLAKAIAASGAVPGIFVPVEINGREYVDGGIVENVPVSAVKQMGATVTIAVNLNGVQHYPKPQDVFDVLSNALDIAINSKTRVQLQAANVVISLDLKQYSLTDNREQTDELIELGYEEAVRKIPKIQWHRRLSLLPRLYKLYQEVNPIRIPRVIRHYWNRLRGG